MPRSRSTRTPLTGLVGLAGRIRAGRLHQLSRLACPGQPDGLARLVELDRLGVQQAEKGHTVAGVANHASRQTDNRVHVLAQRQRLAESQAQRSVGDHLVVSGSQRTPRDNRQPVAPCPAATTAPGPSLAGACPGIAAGSCATRRPATGRRPARPPGDPPGCEARGRSPRMVPRVSLWTTHRSAPIASTNPVPSSIRPL